MFGGVFISFEKTTEIRSEKLDLANWGECSLSAADESEVHVDFVFEGVHEGDPAGFDDVFTHTHSAPDGNFIATFNHYSDACGRAFRAINDANFVVHERHFADGGVDGYESFAEGAVEGIDGAIAFADDVLNSVFGRDFQDSFGHWFAGLVFDVNAIVIQFEGGAVEVGEFHHEEIEGGVGSFELVAFVFEVLNGVEDADHEFAVIADGELAGFGDDVGTS